MSGILGIFRTNGRPVEPEEPRRMVTAMGNWGPDGRRTWVEGPVGLGHLRLCITPESLYESLPLQSDCGKLVITAHCRLDNREELLSHFSIDPVDSPSIPDSSLILYAFQKWGPDCCKHLLGDWAFAIWNREKQELFLARDPIGVSCIHYIQTTKFFGFCSSHKGLLALEGVKKELDTEILISYLSRSKVLHEETIYKGIFLLPPAHWMMIGKGQINRQRYWCLEETSKIFYPSGGDYVEHFLELHKKAVKCRLRSIKDVGLFLSGGLDSGSIAAIAAPELQKQNKQLSAFSSVPLYPSDPVNKQFGYEKPYIEETVRHIGNIGLTYLKADRLSPVEWIKKQLAMFDLPFKGSSNLWWVTDGREKARSMSIGAMLNGTYGNFNISYPGKERLPLLALSGRYPTLIKELNAWSSRHNVSLLYAFRSLVVSPLFQYLKEWAKKPFSSDTIPWHVFVNPARVHERNRRIESFRLPPLASVKRRKYLMRPDFATITGYPYQMGEYYHMENRIPPLDKRIVEFCANIPVDCFFNRGENRCLIRRPFMGRMPGKVLNYPRVFIQNPDIALRLLKIQPAVEQVISDIENSDTANYFLDVPKIKLYFKQVKTEKNINHQHLAGLFLTGAMGYGLFLAQVES